MHGPKNKIIIFNFVIYIQFFQSQ